MDVLYLGKTNKKIMETIMKTKACPRCKVEKLRTDFYKCKPNKDGLAVYCTECDRTNYKLNAEKLRERQKTNREKNKERVKQVRKEYRQKNIEKLREQERIKAKKYRDVKKEKTNRQKNKENKESKEKKQQLLSPELIILKKQKQKEYRELNKEKLSLQSKKYRNKNREKIRNSKNNKIATNPLYKLRENTRIMVQLSIKRKGYTKKTKTYQILGCTYQEFKNHLEKQFQPWMSWDNYGNPKDGIVELNKTWDIDHIIPVSSAKTEEELLKLNHYSNLQPLCSYTNRNIKRNKL